MKTIFKLALSLVVALSTVGSLMAQDINYDDPRWNNFGADREAKEKNIKNYYFFIDAAKMGSFADAEKRLQELIVECPKANESMYFYGISIYRDFLAAAEDNETKFKHLENLMKVYDLRIEHFGDAVRNGKKNNVNNFYKSKMNELISNSFIWENKEDYIIQQMDNTISKCGENTDASIMLMYFNTIVNRFASDETSAEVVLSEYTKIHKAVSECNDQNKEELLKTVENLLTLSNAASCENLEAMFKPKYEADPNNVALIKKIISFMTDNECEGAFKMMLSEKYYKLEPSADAAYALANTFVAQKEYTKSITYFNEAATREQDMATRSKYESRLAATYLILSESRKAADVAQKAITSDPRNGLAHYLLAQAYGMSISNAKCEDNFQKKAAYWFVVDKLNKAKSLLPSTSKQHASIAKSIATFTGHFPSTEDLFFKDLKVGDPFTVDCDWIKGKTTVKQGK